MNNHVKYRFYLICRHPSNVMSNFIDLFLSYFSIYRPTKKSFIFGDDNIDLLKYDTNSQIQRYLNELNSLNFIPLLPTHCAETFATVVDHVFSNITSLDNNSMKQVIQSLTVTSDLTDHYASVIIITSTKVHSNYADRSYIRIYSSSNISTFHNMHSNIDWSFAYNTDSVDVAVTCLTRILTDLANKCFPLVLCSRKSFKDKPWMNKELKKYITIKNNLYVQFMNSKAIADKLIYKSYKSDLDKKLDFHKKQYYSKLLDNRCNSVKSIWKTLNSICNFNNSRSHATIGHLSLYCIEKF